MDVNPNLTPIGNEETLNPTGTETEITVQTPPETLEPQVPEEVKQLKKRYAEARKGAEELLKEKEALAAEKADLEAKLAQADEGSFERELEVKYPDWDLMTESEKMLAKNQEVINKELIKLKEETAWEKDLAKAKLQFPKLIGNEEAFREYCYKYPKSVDAETLAKSFLFEDTTPVKVEVKERKGLETPTAGPNKISTPGMTLADITRLREEQPRLYEKMLKEDRLPKVPLE